MPVITTWNLENFFSPGGAYGPRGQDIYDRKLTYLADRISDLAPDVIAVQEVGDPGALSDLANRLPGAWDTAVSAHPDPRGIRVGFLSRTQLTTVGEISALPAPLLPVQAGDAPTDRDGSMGRGALHVRTTAGGAELAEIKIGQRTGCCRKLRVPIPAFRLLPLGQGGGTLDSSGQRPTPLANVQGEAVHGQGCAASMGGTGGHCRRHR